MARVSVHLPDPVAESLRRLAGRGSVSATAGRLLAQALRDRACAAIGAYEREHDDPEWEAHRIAYGVA